MRTRLALLAAVVLGILAAIGVRMYLTQADSRYEKLATRVGIAVARQTLNKAAFLKDSDVRKVDVDVQAIREDHILYDQRRRWLGQKLTRRVRAGQPIFQSDFLVELAATSKADDKIDTRMRAITIGTDQISGVAGLITPNSRIDILGTFRVPGRGPESAVTVVTKVVARNVQVIAVDHRTDLRIPVQAGRRNASLDYGYSSVTVHATPLEASLLTFVQQTGKVSFTLRNTGDHNVDPRRPADITMTQLDDLIVESEQSRREATTGTRPAGTR
ncbi:Flp pilus assembly protein CpaB [bacterium]|nr:Flp pilus assembly protein CpaB [bacterium]